MADFKNRQDQLRRDLQIMLLKNYGGNKTALADALEILPKVLRDFLDVGVYMQPKRYDNLINKLKNFNLPVTHLDLVGLVNLFSGLDTKKPGCLDKIYHETFDPKDVDRYKLIEYFLNGGEINQIRDLTILDQDYKGIFAQEVFTGFIDTVNKDFDGNFHSRHEALSKYTYCLEELRDNFASYLFGYKAPIYFLDDSDTPKAIIIFMVGSLFQIVNDKVLIGIADEKEIELSVDELTFCNDLSYDYRSNTFLRSCGDFLDPAKAQKN
tara:strand:- start:558 stop:1358 length:801 start_codon:yes stop_codon:yes gene_type:complete